jgi:hypothetical protein
MRANQPNIKIFKINSLRLFGFFLATFFFLTVWGFAEEPTPLPADNYHSALINYYEVSEDLLANAKANGVADEELAVALFIAQRARVEPEAVTGIHSSGLNWMQVAFHYHLNPWIFYTFLHDYPSHTPYESAYEKFKTPTLKINLTDAELAALANLKFLSENYGRDPKEIVQKRASGKTFRQINEDYWNNKSEHDYGWDVIDPNATPTPVPDFFQKVTGGL